MCNGDNEQKPFVSVWITPDIPNDDDAVCRYANDDGMKGMDAVQFAHFHRNRAAAAGLMLNGCGICTCLEIYIYIYTCVCARVFCAVLALYTAGHYFANCGNKTRNQRSRGYSGCAINGNDVCERMNKKKTSSV